jgi:uncharacterized protein YpmB
MFQRFHRHIFLHSKRPLLIDLHMTISCSSQHISPKVQRKTIKQQIKSEQEFPTLAFYKEVMIYIIQSYDKDL